MDKSDKLTTLDRLALEDFGRTDVSQQQRVAARKLAKNKGITPKEALAIINGEAHCSSVDAKYGATQRTLDSSGSSKHKINSEIDPRSYVKSDSGICAYCGRIFLKSEMKSHIEDEHKPKKLKFSGGRVRIPGLLGEAGYEVLDERTKNEDWCKDE